MILKVGALALLAAADSMLTGCALVWLVAAGDGPSDDLFAAGGAPTTTSTSTTTSTDPKWGCVGNVAPAKSGGMTPFSMQLVDLFSSMPVTQNLTIKLCNKYDPTCSSSSALATLSVDSTGTVSSTVASDFVGYLDITDSSGIYIKALIFIDLAIIAQNRTVLLIPKSAEGALATTAGVTLDPNGAIVFIGTADCTGARSAGVSVALTPHDKETGFYLVSKAPSTSATMTDPDGNAGFVNVDAPGTVTITGTVAATSTEMGKVTALVRPGTVTYATVRPTPTR